MISIELTTALMLYFGLFLGGLLLLWVVYGWRRKPRVTSMTKLQTCEYCHYTYLAKTGDPVSKCPQCESLNKDA